MMELFSTSLPAECFALATLLFAAYGIGFITLSRNPAVKFSFGIAMLGFVGWCFSSLDGAAYWVCSILLKLSAVWGVFSAAKDIRKTKLFFAAAALIFLAFFGSCVLYPYGWDECVYQTALLKHYVQNQSNAVIPDNPFSYFPSLPHSVMRLGIELAGGGIRLPRLLSGAVMAIALAAVVSTSARFGKKTALLFSAAAILSPAVLVLARANYAEQYILLFAAAGALLIAETRNTPILCAIATGVFSAAAFSVKLTGAGAVIALGILFLFLCRKKKFHIACLCGAAVFVVFALPFFIRPYLASGNPFYPFCNWIFSADQAANLVSHHHHQLGSFRYGTGFLSGICYGWLFTVISPALYDGISCGWQIPLMFITSAAATVYLFKTASERRKISLVMLLCSFALYIFWAATSQQSRFMLPLLMLNAVLCSFVLKGLPRKAGVFIAWTVMLSALIPFPANHVKHFATAWKIAPEISKDPVRFLAAATRDKGYFEMAEFFKTVPKDSKILLMINERRTLYLPRKAVIGEPYFQKLNTPVPENKHQLLDNIKSFDYIVISTCAHDPDAQQSTAEEIVRLAGLFTQLREENRFQLVFSDSKGEYLIFRCGDTATGAAL